MAMAMVRGQVLVGGGSGQGVGAVDARECCPKRQLERAKYYPLWQQVLLAFRAVTLWYYLYRKFWE